MTALTIILIMHMTMHTHKIVGMDITLLSSSLLSTLGDSANFDEIAVRDFVKLHPC